MQNIFYYYTGVMWIYALMAALWGSAIMANYSKSRLFWFFACLFFNFYFFLFIVIWNFFKSILNKKENRKMVLILVGYVVFVVVPIIMEIFLVE